MTCRTEDQQRCARRVFDPQSFMFAQQPSRLANGWWGSLLRYKEDATGTQYRRNRYVDPATGRFTQEDPIGLAGGLNLYVFANGDPVTFSDPFGLCYDKQTKQERECKVDWAQEASDKHISAQTALEVQNLADKANVDLTLSSGLRTSKSCSATLHACGTAVDINAINGRDVGDGTTPRQSARPFVDHLQKVASGMGNIQENLGPAGLFRSNAPGQPQVQFTNDGLQNAHNNHVHEGFRRSLGPNSFLDPIYRTLLRNP